MVICFLCPKEIEPQIDELMKSLVETVKQGKVKPKKPVRRKLAVEDKP